MTLRNACSLLCAGLLSLAYCHAASAARAPEFVLPTDNGTVDLQQLKGDVVYLDFWASWCPPCRQSFPWLNAMQRRYGSDGFAVVAVNLDKSRDLARRFLHELPPAFTVAYDPAGKVADAYQVVGMPSSFIIDRSGHIRESHVGFLQEDAPQLEDRLRSILAR